jgi:predicted ATPase
MTSRFHIITGAPGTGKTSILEGLGAKVHRFAEPARQVLARWRASGNPRPAQMKPAAFVGSLLRQSIEHYEKASRLSGPVVFDRGVPDCVAYANYLGTSPEAAVAATAEYRYTTRVLVARPWEDIYVTDDERTMPFGAVVRFQAAIDVAYGDAGYQLIEIPKGSVDERVEFVASIVAGLPGS